MGMPSCPTASSSATQTAAVRHAARREDTLHYEIGVQCAALDSAQRRMVVPPLQAAWNRLSTPNDPARLEDIAADTGVTARKDGSSQLVGGEPGDLP
jgi:hypothetical protein